MDGEGDGHDAGPNDVFPLEKLPPELMDHVFSFIDGVDLVMASCTSLAMRAVLRPRMLRAVDASNHSAEELIVFLEHSGQYVSRLVLSNPSYTSELVERALSQCPSLNSLRLGPGMRLFNVDFLFGSACRALTALDLSGVPIIAAADLLRVVEALPQLRDLTLPVRWYGHREPAFAAAMKARHLRSLTMEWCYSLDEATLSDTLSAQPHLDALRFCDGSIKDAAFAELALHCPQLRCLSLRAPVSAAILAQLERLVRLEDLELHSLLIQAPSLVFSDAMAARLRRLVVVAPEGSGDAQIAQLLRQCVNLRSLSLKVTMGKESAAALKLRASALRALDLSGCRFQSWRVDDLMPDLLVERLVLDNLQTCSDLTIQRLTANRALVQRLQQLSLNGCSRLTVESIRLISEHCRQLRRLSLVDVRLDEPDWNDIFARFDRNCPFLAHIEVSNHYAPHFESARSPLPLVIRRR